jgi:hypothetical protein
VSEHDFFFALDIADEPELDRMLAELASAVFGYVGYAPGASDDLAGVMRKALAERVAAGQRRCTVRFQSIDGQLQVVVAGGSQPEWRTSRPLPSP